MSKIEQQTEMILSLQMQNQQLLKLKEINKLLKHTQTQALTTESPEERSPRFIKYLLKS